MPGKAGGKSKDVVPGGVDVKKLVKASIKEMKRKKESA